MKPLFRHWMLPWYRSGHGFESHSTLNLLNLPFATAPVAYITAVDFGAFKSLIRNSNKLYFKNSI